MAKIEWGRVGAVVNPGAELDDTAARWFLGCRVWTRAAAGQTRGSLGVIEQIVPPGLGSPYHVHRREDEAFYVLEGAVRFFSGERSWVLGPGGFAFLPRDLPHGFRTEGDVPSRPEEAIAEPHPPAPATWRSFVAVGSTPGSAASSR